MRQANPQRKPNSLSEFSTASHDIDAWLAYLESLHPKNIEMGLERMAQVFRRMALPRLAGTVITVAGTNGKGSTCAFIEACLRQAGYRVGVYSSPHLLRFSERVRIDGQELSDARHIAALQRVESLRDDVQLTFFEFTTLSALQLFSEANLDVLILEVGLGGRLDATNIIEPDVAVVTTVAQDHEAFLGNDLQQIGREKAGIFRPGKPAILGDAELPASVAEHAAAIGAFSFAVGQDFQLQQQANGLCYRSKQVRWQGLEANHLPTENLPTALAALEQSGLALTEQQVRLGVQQAALPGRWQRISEQPEIRLDVAHNPQATQWLAKRIARNGHIGKTIALVGMLADKDSMNALANMLPVVDQWHVASLQPPRGADASMLLQHLPKTAQQHADVASAYRQLVQTIDKEDLLIVFGSFYTVAAVLTA